MKIKTFMLCVPLIYPLFPLLECKAFLPLHLINSAQSTIELSSRLQQTTARQPVEPKVEIKLVKMLWRKYPKKELLMNLTLHNNYNQPCWFLLPSSIYSEDSLNTPLGQGNYSVVETLELNGKGRVILGDFVGDNGHQILLLPPNAKLKIRQFSINYWSSKIKDEKISIEVVIADQVNIDGESAQAWFKVNPMSDVQADVSADQPKSLGSKRPTGEFRRLHLSIVEKERFKVEVPLIKKGN